MTEDRLIGAAWGHRDRFGERLLVGWVASNTKRPRLTVTGVWQDNGRRGCPIQSG